MFLLIKTLQSISINDLIDQLFQHQLASMVTLCRVWQCKGSEVRVSLGFAGSQSAFSFGHQSSLYITIMRSQWVTWQNACVCLYLCECVSLWGRGLAVRNWRHKVLTLSVSIRKERNNNKKSTNQVLRKQTHTSESPPLILPVQVQRGRSFPWDGRSR